MPFGQHPRNPSTQPLRTLPNERGGKLRTANNLSLAGRIASTRLPPLLGPVDADGRQCPLRKPTPAGPRAEYPGQPQRHAEALAAGDSGRHHALPAEGRAALDEDEARRQIAALKAITQIMLHEVYWGSGSETGRKRFDLGLQDDEVLAMAIANELGADELDHAFGWTDAGLTSGRDELAANPVTPHLSEEQRMRARVALLAQEEADHAHTLAVRAPDRPGVAPLSNDERIRFAEEAFLGRLEIDVLHEREGWSSFTMLATVTERAYSLTFFGRLRFFS